MSQIPTPPQMPVEAIAVPAWKAKLTDYVELSKLRISIMVLATVTVGYLLGSRGDFQIITLLNALCGIGLVAAASSMFNQVYEKRTDALMQRTQDRPLPAGRITSTEAMIFGSICGIYGSLHLLLFVNPLTAVLTLATLVMYVGIYTPMKRFSSLCTTIGAIPGALPPVLGWAASGQSLTLDPLCLFAIMFVWQFPHFFAIAWMYREQYAKAGLYMLPNQIPARTVTGLLAVAFAVLLIPVSLMSSYYGMTGPVYSVIATLLGVTYLGYSIQFAMNETRPNARRLLFCSLFYLPIILTAFACSYLG